MRLNASRKGRSRDLTALLKDRTDLEERRRENLSVHKNHNELARYSGKALGRFPEPEVQCSEEDNGPKLKMACKRRNMFYQNKKQETTEIGTCNLPSYKTVSIFGVRRPYSCR
ncbi:hypothetical protein AAG570_004175 [Ranatra chinensis]|uniref:Uncharacterized protein n=1 Tax=Ranatra chinensis TaxID=642074 RepID=A0ABD0Y303_9HEMI